jgi:hypothetical protein
VLNRCIGYGIAVPTTEQIRTFVRSKGCRGIPPRRELFEAGDAGPQESPNPASTAEAEGSHIAALRPSSATPPHSATSPSHSHEDNAVGGGCQTGMPDIRDSAASPSGVQVQVRYQ